MPEAPARQNDEPRGAADLGIGYSLEIREPGDKSTLHDLTWVESVTVNQPMAVSVNYPINDVRRGIVQRSKLRREQVTLSGAVGVEERTSRGADGLDATLDGRGRINALKDFLKAFIQLGSEQEGALSRRVPPGPDGMKQEAVQLLLHMHYEGLSYILVSADLQRSMTLDTALGDFAWTLTCITLESADKVVKPVSPLDAGNPNAFGNRDTVTGWETNGTTPGGYWNPDAITYRADPAVLKDVAHSAQSIKNIKAGAEVTSTWAEDAFEWAGTARIAVEKAIYVMRGIRAQEQRLKDGVARANLVLVRVAELRGVTRQVKEFPAALFSAAIRLTQDVLDEIVEVAEELNEGGWLDSQIRDLHILSADYNRAITRLAVAMAQSRFSFLGGSTDVPHEGPAQGSPFYRMGRRVRAVFVGDGETLGELAYRTLGDRSRWFEIAELNGLADPWALRDGSPLAAGGATMIVPTVDGTGAEPVSAKGYDLIGETYYLDPETSDLVMRETGFQRIRDVPLIIQGIRERARNVRGHSAAAPEWGLLELVGSSVARGEATRFAVDARGQFLRDPRVTRVSNLRLAQDGDTIIVDLDIDTVAGEGPVTVSTPVPMAR